MQRALATVLAFAALLVLGMLVARPAHAATFTVNKTGDAGDRRLSDAACDSSRKRGKQCTLRAAIQEANDTLGADTINFNIESKASVKTISPASPLPEITDPVTINGYSQRRARENTLAEGNNAVLKVQLNGTNAGTKHDGLQIRTSNSTIKGLVINRFVLSGLQIGGTGATGNRVEGNFIGATASGSGDLGNGANGVQFNSAPNNTIGGVEPGARNVISGNGENGIEISGAAATGNEVRGNFIGTNADGSSDLGNDGNGVFLDGASNDTVGGTDADDGAVDGVVKARNVISGNGEASVRIEGAGATSNKVEGNFIGTNADGTGDLGNNGGGVIIANASNNTIGGTDADDGADDGVVKAANVISGNRFDGVLIFGTGATGNSVLSNRIFSNDELGIDLDGGGVTANDTGDDDTGANNLQNFPVITSVTQASTFLNPTRISGTLNSTPNDDFTVQCFLAAGVPENADASGHGEGQGFVAEDTDVRTSAGGDASFECNFPFPISLEGKRWSATATNNATGDTSEFSANFPVG